MLIVGILSGQKNHSLLEGLLFTQTDDDRTQLQPHPIP